MSPDTPKSAAQEQAERIKKDQELLPKHMQDPMRHHLVTMKKPGAVTVGGCDHRFDPRVQPRHNCHNCWEVYFHFHPVEVEAMRSALKVYGEQKVINKRGAKYVKWVKKFVEALNEKEAAEALKQSVASQDQMPAPLPVLIPEPQPVTP